MAPLHGRTTECETLRRVLREARAGHSAALVVRGEAGIGKTALLDYAVDASSGYLVGRARAAESEMGLPFAALHQLCRGIEDRIAGLSGPQAAAIATALGLRTGDPPDRYLVGLAALTLVSYLGSDQPLLWVVDDAQWLDRPSAQTLAFVGRRLATDSVALLFGERVRPRDDPLDGLPELVVAGLSDDAAGELLASAVPGGFDAAVRDRIVAEARGNPLAVLELSRGVAPGDLGGGFEVGSPTRPSSPIGESIRQRSATLPAQTRLLLLLAAAEPVGDPALLWRAAAHLGIRAHHAAPAEAKGIIRFDGRVTFPHPLVRGAVYRAASGSDRRLVHRALAKATNSRADPDRRAWHRAHSTSGPDERVARELERRAEHARTRGGLAAQAALLAQAAALTPKAARRARRALTAARAKHRAGAHQAALDLAAVADTGPLDEFSRAELEHVRAQIDFHIRHGGDTPLQLLAAATRLSRHDAGLARETYLEALEAAVFSGRFGGDGAPERIAIAARDAPPAPRSSRAVDLLLGGLTALHTEGRAVGYGAVRPALAAFVREPDIRWLWLAGHTALAVWDDETSRALTSQHINLVRDSGDLTVLPLFLDNLAAMYVDAGNFSAAADLIDEADAITAKTGGAPVRCAALLLAAWRGDQERATELVEACTAEATSRGEALTVACSELALAVLHNSRLDPLPALRAAERATDNDELGFGSWALPELVEAATRCGRDDQAARALDLLTDQARLSGSDLALGMAARSRALVSDGDAGRGLV